MLPGEWNEALPLPSLFSLSISHRLQDTGSQGEVKKGDRLYLASLGSFYSASPVAQVWAAGTCVTWHHSAIVLPTLLLLTQGHVYSLPNGSGIVLLTVTSHQVALYNAERPGWCLENSVFSSSSENTSLNLCCCLTPGSWNPDPCKRFGVLNSQQNIEVKYSRACSHHF